MSRVLLTCVVIFLCGTFMLAGCGTKKEESPGAAIQKSQTFATDKQRADYLIGQAKAFYNSKQYNDAMSIAQYVISYVDSNSTAAKSIIEKARDQITAQAKQAAENMKKQFANFGK